ncbi:MAG: hypothetical protein O3A46_14605 [Candidatus Poribacteria bacterium]|nr:hypothetical protein [Candidatus Poribacteria bacterium]
MRENARQCYERFRRDPNAPSLRFQPVRNNPRFWRVDLGRYYRAVCERRPKPDGDELLWVFIGSHEAYNDFLHQRT